MKRVSSLVLVALITAIVVHAQNPEPAGWFAGDMHVHRSCGGSPEALSSMYSKMSDNNLSAISLLADMGNGEVQNPTTDLPLVNGQDASVSTPGRIVHWDTEWHWDATYTQYPHQALGGHIVALGLSSAQQIWQEYTYPILNWAHQRGGIAGFAHLQYLDGNFPTTLTCCSPVEYPVEVALGAADFISEDVADSGSQFYDSGTSVQIPMNPEIAIQAYYKLLNAGFRPSFVAGTDYPCNDSRPLGNLLTYAQPASGQMTYSNWIDAIKNGRTVVSRNGHNEFLSLTVNGVATPGDEIDLAAAGSVQVSIQWTASQNLTGTIQLVNNGTVVASQAASAGPGTPATWTGTVNFPRSGWLTARRMGADGHQVHTAAVFVIVNGAPIRASAADAQYYVNWMTSLLANTSTGGVWNSYFPTSLSAAQARYSAAQALYQQIASEAQGTGPTLSSITVTPGNLTISPGTAQSYIATGTYSNGNSLNITGQVKWASSDSSIADISPRGLVLAGNAGTTTISATQGSVTGSTTLTVQSAPLTITTTTVPNGIVALPYSFSLAASGGVLSYTWSLTSGALPAGLSLSAAGQISGTPTLAGTSSFTVQVMDSTGARASKTLNLTIAAASTNYTIWSSTAVPGIADSGPDAAVELGVTFKADVDGYVSGIRFYKGTGNTGIHVGNLWSSAGANLGSATFPGESASGWQQVNFTTPIAIKAGTVYIASYHTNTGHYSDDQNYFSTKGVDNPPLHALQDGVSGGDGVYAYGSSSSFPNGTWNSSNYWVDVVFTSTPTPPSSPTVTSTSPIANTTGVPVTSAVTAQFNVAMTASSINSSTFQLLAPSNTPVAASVTYNSANFTATLTPTSPLGYSTNYTAVVHGGASGVLSQTGSTMASDYTWTFSTTKDASSYLGGPGGPILVITSISSDPFTTYLLEILRNEGFNEFATADLSQVTSTTLSNYSLVILGHVSLTSAQVSMFTNWVTSGGDLIAMRPDKQLASLLGLTSVGAARSDAYLLVNTSSGPGVGIVGQTMQYHGTADLYSTSGASAVATLYSNASTATSNPAVTLINVGTNGGQAAAFTYDLARSVVYTRQGNPAWSGQARDGQSGPIRSDDLYFGAASFDPQPDYVDLSKVAIPQADEQQRLLANLIVNMQATKPLPRFWYFPSGYKAVVVMTGDDHGSFYSASATAQRFNDFIADSVAGCSVLDWQCVRATSYLFPQSLASNSLTDAQAASYVSQGFEIAMHGDSSPTCSNWTTAALDSFYVSELASFASQFPSVPAPHTHRMHCIGWSDYDSQPRVEYSHGIRLDTTYYYWPPTWINNVPGMFTGSGMPMRYTDINGNMIDVYQATTQMTDESGQTYPFNIDTLLNNAVGSTGYYGAFAANMHNDQGSYPGPGANQIVSSAQAHSVPVVSALQMLTWLDGRNASSFGATSWSGNILTFTIAQAAGARNLTALLPLNSASASLSSLSRGAASVSYTIQTIKGVTYAVFSAVTGTYQATYGSPLLGATLASISLSPAAVNAGGPSTGTVTLTSAAPSGGANVTLSSSDTTVAQVPASVTVAAGSTTATFPVSTSAVSTTTSVTVTGTYGSAATAILTVSPDATLSSLTLSPTSITGGSSSTGTVTLTAAAPTGGAVVTLSSNNTSAATVPASVTVPAGATTATFTVTTSPVTATATVAISGTYAVTRIANLTVNAAVLSSISRSVSSIVGGNSLTGTVTLNGIAPTGGALVSLSSSNTAAAQMPTSVTVLAGATSATFTITTNGVASATSVTLTAVFGVTRTTSLTVNPASLTSLSLSPSTVTHGSSSTGTVTLNGAAPSTGAVVTLSSSNTSVARVPSSVTIPAGARSATFTASTVAAGTARISGTYRGTTQRATLTVQ